MYSFQKENQNEFVLDKKTSQKIKLNTLLTFHKLLHNGYVECVLTLDEDVFLVERRKKKITTYLFDPCENLIMDEEY